MRFASARTCRRAMWLFGTSVALLQTWAFRHSIQPDGISYLDIAREVAHGNLAGLIDGYWSPLYPFVMGVVMRVVKPSMATELTVAHAVNFGIFLFSFACFDFFLSSVIRAVEKANRARQCTFMTPAWVIWTLGNSIFIFFTLLFMQMGLLHPDLLLAAFVYLAEAAVFRIYSEQAGWFTHILLGISLGLAYLAKAVMFPVSLVLLLCVLFCGPSLMRSILRTAVALAVFLAISAVLIIPLSKKTGRISTGSVGKISYAEFVDGAARYINWQGGPGATGHPIHPTRFVMTDPPVYEFAAPIGGSYPPWYDPSYWYDGIVPAFKLSNQLRAVRYTIEEYASILPYMGALLCGFASLLWFAMLGDSWRQISRAWCIWLPPVFALGLYSLVYVESRFLVPFVSILWVALFALLLFEKLAGTERAVPAIVFGVALTLGIGTLWLGARATFRGLVPEPFTDLRVAQDLRAIGVKPDDHVASIGFALNAYWAHLAEVRIVAEVPVQGRDEFWRAQPAVQSQVFSRFEEAGATIVISDETPPWPVPPGWQALKGTGYFFHWLGAHAVAQ